MTFQTRFEIHLENLIADVTSHYIVCPIVYKKLDKSLSQNLCSLVQSQIPEDALDLVREFATAFLSSYNAKKVQCPWSTWKNTYSNEINTVDAVRKMFYKIFLGTLRNVVGKFFIVCSKKKPSTIVTSLFSKSVSECNSVWRKTRSDKSSFTKNMCLSYSRRKKGKKRNFVFV